MLLQKIKNRFKKFCINRKLGYFREKTIFSNNCLAYFIYKDLNVRYLSPTIGIQIPIMDFMKMCNNIDFYLASTLTEGRRNDFFDAFKAVGGEIINFPCAYLDDIKIMFQHEKSFIVAKEKWDRRSERIRKDPIAIIWVHSFELTEEIIQQIDSISIKKIVLSDSPYMNQHKDWYYIKIPRGKEWWQSDNTGLRYFEKIRWNKVTRKL